MMKKLGLFTGMLLLSCNIGLFAQGNEIDAFTLSNTEMNGTARSVAMGNAFGALGGDISVISSNPAGLGIYRSSEISGSLDLSIAKTSTNWSGVGADRNKTRFAPNNFGFEFYFPTSSGSIRNWNFGFSYNRVKNFDRRYKMSNNGQEYSMADYAAQRASGIPENDLKYVEGSYDPYDRLPWFPVIGYESGMFRNQYGKDGEYHSDFGFWNESKDDWRIYKPQASRLSVNESGYMDEYNIGLGMNISNFLFLGGSISVTDLNYKYASFYEDFFSDDPKGNNLYLENWLNTEGTGVSVNVGAIMNLQIFRLGLAYNSPRWYKMTDYFDARAGTYNLDYEKPANEAWTPENSYNDYRFRTPGKWIFSAAFIIGQSALISADYEMANYKNMHYSSRNDDPKHNQEFPENKFIKGDFTWGHTLKLGAEVKITPQFAVRAGYMEQTSPMRKGLADNNVEVLPSGTHPHFTVTSKPTSYYTVGLGYRFTPNIYMDLACVYRYNSAYAYAFSNIYNDNKEVAVESIPASLKTKTTHLMLTLGYKF
ncbi:MAG: outer membrane protein transport protein [Tannerella sp.]|jgi:hypothetical protein|nr:outer membrane protein transport protein [Tannerella sp.]